MGRVCSICTHPRRRDIDRLLVNPTLSMREVAQAIPGVGEKSLERHRNNHLMPRIQKAEGLTREEVGEAVGLVGQMDELRERAMELLDKAEDSGDLRTAIAAIREARGVLDSLARLSGEGSRPGTVINVFNAPAWVSVQTNIMAALMPFPDARQAVVKALEGVTSD
ncbi:hypothetical protein [Tanticharoenia sakaeratensis]|uniref:Uncharacterized protein n=1 Tax=Tanticharoenia sakaeratensis NBRC 103193 TaxID=1231623 RepID=A0A0D6MQ02_9PROT|nr:hypothetical protein [Tanticharoenia sakaeratensis]GAN55470.1 hypothetical protein Tasa_048_095 [Tanticharoenia sakaeratensis NBRC 103193]GBQ21987.1 hypothetical protein AA103193_1916 [Tanticharoenia sakaeratensis NBRC 103193]